MVKQDRKIILVSGSPRRKELLKIMGWDFEVVSSDIEEVSHHLSPSKYAEEIAKKKLIQYRDQSIFKQSWAIAADTIVVLDEKILGKPKDREEAEAFLRSLSGNTHQVITAYVIAWDGVVLRERSVCTKVTFDHLDAATLHRYLETQEYQGKAGAYGIQGTAMTFIKSIEGSLTNVIGLPTAELKSDMSELGEESV